MVKKLKYLGPGFVPGVPAQDVEVEDDKEADELVKSGVYELATKKGDKNDEEK